MGALSLHVFMFSLYQGFEGVREEEVRSFLCIGGGLRRRIAAAQGRAAR